VFNHGKLVDFLVPDTPSSQAHALLVHLLFQRQKESFRWEPHDKVLAAEQWN